MEPMVKRYVSYIEGCGHQFLYYTRPWYVFKIFGRNEMTFTLGELREVFKMGF